MNSGVLSTAGSVPPLTVLMAVHNGEPYVADAVRSILTQTYRRFRFLIVDDASTDSTVEVIRSFRDPRVDLVCLPRNVGPAAALNRGLERIRSPWIARQDADDISDPRRLELQIARLESCPELGVLGTACHVIDGKGARVRSYAPPLTDTAIRWHMLFHNAFVHSSVMFRGAFVWEQGLRYDEEFPCVEDFELWSRVLRQSRGANLEPFLLSLRKHAGNMSASVHSVHSDQYRQATEVARRSLGYLLPGVQLLPEQVSEMRQWYWRTPSPLHGAHYRYCCALFDILHRFVTAEHIDKAEALAIHRAWVARLLRSMSPVFRLRMAFSPCCLSAVLGTRPLAMLAALAAGRGGRG